MVSTIYALSLDVLVTSGAAKTSETALVKFIGFSGTSQSHCAQASATFFLKIKLTSVSRGLRGVFLSTIRNLAYTVLRVLSRGQNYRFRMVVTEET